MVKARLITTSGWQTVRRYNVVRGLAVFGDGRIFVLICMFICYRSCLLYSNMRTCQAISYKAHSSQLSRIACASCLLILMNALHGQWIPFCIAICRHCHNATRPQPDPRRVSARFRLDLPEHGLRPVPGGRRPALRSLVTRLPSPHNHHVRLDSLLFPLLHFVYLSFLDPFCYDSATTHHSWPPLLHAWSGFTAGRLLPRLRRCYLQPRVFGVYKADRPIARPLSRSCRPSTMLVG